MTNSLKQFEEKYMDGDGRKYDGEDFIDHSLFREFLHYLGNKQELNTLGIPNIAGLQEALESVNIKLQTLQNKGMQNGTVIALAANVSKAYVLPSNAMLFAIELKGAGTVQIGKTQSTLGDLGEITGVAGVVLQLGLLNVSEVWLQSDADVEVIPIIYKR